MEVYLFAMYMRLTLLNFATAVPHCIIKEHYYGWADKLKGELAIRDDYGGNQIVMGNQIEPATNTYKIYGLCSLCMICRSDIEKQNNGHLSF